MPSLTILSLCNDSHCTVVHDRFVYSFFSTLPSFHPNVCLFHSLPPSANYRSFVQMHLFLLRFLSFSLPACISVHEYGRLFVCFSKECFQAFFFGFSVQLYFFSELLDLQYEPCPLSLSPLFHTRSTGRAIGVKHGCPRYRINAPGRFYSYQCLRSWV